MREICQNHLPLKHWMEEKTRRLPGLQLIAPGEWLQQDEAYAAQMAYREELLKDKRDAVYRSQPEAEPAALELLEKILSELEGRPGYELGENNVVCSDGRAVAIDRDQPLLTAGRLVQEDLMLLEKRGDEHMLTAAFLCFPTSWLLAEKFNRPLLDIHTPVPNYDTDIANRVQRMFDLIKEDKPMYRANYLIYSNPDLHQPRKSDNRRSLDKDGRLWARVERQSLVKLPKSGAVVFSIHSYVVRPDVLSAEEWAKLKELRLKGESHMHV